jgi:hypothetical protein
MESQFVLRDVGSKYLNAIGIQFADILILYCLLLTECMYTPQISFSIKSTEYTGFYKRKEFQKSTGV